MMVRHEAQGSGADSWSAPIRPRTPRSRPSTNRDSLRRILKDIDELAGDLAKDDSLATYAQRCADLAGRLRRNLG
jgi:hypothetical protein